MKVTKLEFVIFCLCIVVIIVALASYIANAVNKIDEGIVVDKDYNAACSLSGTYYPEEYILTIEGEKNGTTVQYKFEVPETEYVYYDIGDYYSRNGVKK